MSQVDQTLGMFLNTIPTRVRLDPTATVRELLTDIQARHASMLDHHYVGLPEIHRSVGLPELFDTAITFQSFPARPGGTAAACRIGRFTGGRAQWCGRDSVSAEPGRGAEAGRAQRDRGIRDGGAADHPPIPRREFDTASARRILDRFVELLGWIAANAAGRLGDLTLTERSGPSWPISTAAHAIPDTLDRILAESVAAAPDAIAVRYDTTALTYRQLDERSTRLARVLLRHGARRGKIVAAALPRSLEATVTWWAAAKAGVVILPIDPNLPLERIEFLLSDSGTGLGLTDTSSRKRLPGGIDWLIVDDVQTLRAMDSIPAAPITDAERGVPIGGISPRT